MKPPQMKIVEVKWPLGGLNRRMGYQSQPPYTTVDALNVQNDHYPSYRERGGSRPGLIPAFRNEIGSGAPVRMFAKLDLIEATGLTIEADETAVPISRTALHTAEMLGLDPLSVANEGKVVMVVPPNDAERVLAACRDHKYGKDAAVIGRFTDAAPPLAELITRAGGRRMITRPYGEELPRIC